MKKREIVFTPNTKIHAGAHELVWRLFRVKGAMITNESLLEDFMDLEDIPNHTLRRFSALSKEEKKRYAGATQQDARSWAGLLVWYPPLTDAERHMFAQKEREVLAERIADVYGFIIPEVIAGETRVWEVVKLVAQKQANAGRKQRLS